MSTRNLYQQISGFTGGLNTERTAINVLPTELMDGSINFDISQGGALSPRRGADFVGASPTSGNYIHEGSTNYLTTLPSQHSPSAIFFEFSYSGGFSQRVVVYDDNKFKIYYSNLGTNGISDFDNPLQTIDPATVDASYNHVTTDQLSYHVTFAIGNNKLFFCGPYLQYGYLAPNHTTGVLEITWLEIRRRDLAGGAASSRVKHNNVLYECCEAHTSASTDEPGVGANWEDYWIQLDGPVGSASAWALSTGYTTNIVKEMKRTIAMAGKNRPQHCCYWAGRLWLFTSFNQFADRLWYSQTADDDRKYTEFHTVADPFDSSDPDPVDSDGGYISVGDGWGTQLVPFGDSLLVATNRAIYEVRGVNGVFKHTEYSIVKVLDEGTNGVDNMVVAGNRVYVFTRSNIWVSVAVEDRFTDTNIAFRKVGDDFIKTYYKNVPRLNKGTAHARYNPSENRIYWFHNGTIEGFDEAYRGVTGQNGFSRNALVIDVVAAEDPASQDDRSVEAAVGLYRFEGDPLAGDVYIAGSYVAPEIKTDYVYVVDSNGDYVIDSNGDYVVTESTSGSEIDSEKVYLLVLRRYTAGVGATHSSCIGKLNSEQLTDWASSDTYEQNYTCRAITGVQISGDSLHKKTFRYLHFLFDKLTDGIGSCLLQVASGYYDYTSTSDAHVGSAIEIYKESKLAGAGVTISQAGRNQVEYKHRVRKRGNAVQIIFTSTPGKDFKLLGWGQQFHAKVD